ncbi:MAG: hypothetical protein JWQ18_746 [Conexibacter sp.]|nr:hypothetical protein [Conexibacter sp.]
MKLPRLLAAAAALAVLVPTVAQAALPQPTSRLIVANTSLAGVVLNSSYAKAHKAWGTGGVCSPTTGCVYSKDAAVATNGSASFTIAQVTTTAKPKVVQISLRAGTTASGTYVFDQALTRYTTSKGIGLGSTTAQLKHAYAHIHSEAGGFGYYLKGTGARQTTFNVNKGRVVGIFMNSVHLG